MKTLFRTYDEKQAREKARAYTAEYGVAFDFYRTGDGWQVRPIIDKNTQATGPDAATAAVLETVKSNRFGLSFTAIADATRLSIQAVLSASLYLIRSGAVTPDVSRSGRAAGIHPKGR